MSGVETMIDINKKYTTRDGCEVRIYATDGGGDCPVHGAIKQSGCTWQSWEAEFDEAADKVGRMELAIKERV